MFQHFVKIAFRHFRKNQVLSLLNLFGLGIGFASFLVISFYVIQESSYEQSFENSERTYRIATHHGGFGDVAQSTSNLAHTIEEIPGIEVFTALTKSENDKVKIGENTFGMKRLFEVDKAFFDVFDYELLHGDFNTALGKPNQVVLMEEQALRLFNKTDVLGESIEIMNRGDFIITGVIKTPIYKSHLSFDLLIPRDKMTFRTSRWNTTNAYCYVMLEKGMDAQVVNNNLLGLVEKHVWPLNSDYFPDMTFEEWAQGEFRTQYYTQPIEEIYLKSDLAQELAPGGNATEVNSFAILAILILIIACINSINLLTARSSARVKEVGMRKVFGTAKRLLVLQFFTESFLLTSVSALLALGITELTIQLINVYLPGTITFSFQNVSWLIWPILVFIVILGFLSGIYPALYLSSVRITALLKGRIFGRSLDISNGKFLRNILVVLQFTLSIFLITATLFVYNQINHLKNKDLGLQPKDILVVTNAMKLGNSQEAFTEEIANLPMVQSVGYSSYHQPGDLSETMHVKLTDNHENEVSCTWLFSDENYFQTLGIEILNGRGYTKSMTLDTAVVIVNQATVKAFGFKEPLNEIIGHANGRRYRIIGVVQDFNYESLRASIEPAVFFLTKRGSKCYINLNLNQENISRVKEVWGKFTNEPIEFNFLETNFQEQISVERKTAGWISLFTILAVVISCIGLLGLAIFTADQRLHEFGIRKVLGASVQDIMRLFSYDFMRLTVIAFLIAIPISVLGMNYWLQGFADRISLSVGGFILAGLLAMFIAFGTILFQSVKTGRLNPVDTIGNE